MVREGAPSTTFSVAGRKVVDGGPSPAMTVLVSWESQSFRDLVRDLSGQALRDEHRRPQSCCPDIRHRAWILGGTDRLCPCVRRIAGVPFFVTPGNSHSFRRGRIDRRDRDRVLAGLVCISSWRGARRLAIVLARSSFPACHWAALAIVPPSRPASKRRGLLPEVGHVGHLPWSVLRSATFSDSASGRDLRDADAAVSDRQRRLRDCLGHRHFDAWSGGCPLASVNVRPR